MTKIAIIGVGRWGKNLVREFDKIADIKACCYKGNHKTSQWLKKHYPAIKKTDSYEEILRDKNIEAAVIATPIKTHFQIAQKALKAGKHVFLEKPMTDNPATAKKLVALAEKNNLILFIGHIFAYHPVLQKIKNLIKNDPVIYAKFNWDKLGHFTENILWNLFCHELSIAMEIIGVPKKISILDQKGFVTDGDTISLKINFANNKSIAFFDINRISKQKNKTVTFLTASKKIFVWENDSLYRLNDAHDAFNLIYKAGVTPLEIECREFLKSLKTKNQPLTNGSFGLKIVELLADANS